jgi:hypothetical protein
VQHPDGECHEKRDFRNLARQLNVLVRIRTGSRHRRIRLALRRPQVAARGPHLSADPTSSVASVCAKLGAYRVSRKIRPLCVCVCARLWALRGKMGVATPQYRRVMPWHLSAFCRKFINRVRIAHIDILSWQRRSVRSPSPRTREQARASRCDAPGSSRPAYTAVPITTRHISRPCLAPRDR